MFTYTFFNVPYIVHTLAIYVVGIHIEYLSKKKNKKRQPKKLKTRERQKEKKFIDFSVLVLVSILLLVRQLLALASGHKISYVVCIVCT